MTIVHPRLVDQLKELARSVCDVQVVSTAEPTAADLDSFGHDLRVPVDVPGLQGLSCQLKPASADEVTASGVVVSTKLFRVALLGYYPTITTRHVAVIDGVTYEIVGVDSDSQSNMTYLTAKKVTL